MKHCFSSIGALLSRRWLVVLAALLLSVAFPPESIASVKDKNLAKCLDKIGKKHQWKTPEEFKEITCHNGNIASLEGLEQYVNIENLSLHKNDIVSFDATSFKALKMLNLGRNKLENLVLQDLPELREFFVFNNRLKTLSINHLPKLSRFKANSNDIQTFEYANVPELTKIYLFDNQMEHIDIYSAPSMTYMDVRQNPMPDSLYEDMDKMKGTTILHDGNADDWN